MDWTYLPQLLWFFLPAYVANAVPPLLAKLPGLRTWTTPVDFGKRWNRRRILGSHKTWRGLIGGVLLAGLVFLLQAHYSSLAPAIPFNSLPFWFGFLLGAGALLGDLVESFVKRRLQIKPGGTWVPFDQVDYALGALLLSAAVYWPGFWPAFFLLVLSGLGSALGHCLGHYLKINKERF